MSKVLYLIVCGAAPAAYANRFVSLARDDDWDVWVITTPAARDFTDLTALEKASGHPVRDSYKRPGENDLGMPRADAVVVAPASMNTIGKWANGICDTLATGILGESLGFGVPLVALPFVSDAQAKNAAYVRNARFLQDGGVVFPVGIKRPSRVRDFPWKAALDALL
ncbi:flavoprotein [Actinomadura alba]|uniref:Flavoprotein n=1 Tax=Actinomadura alba TaxID=406431 RepID=A0ABR7LW78_9ACTN|nr:flavoprotein [Actinomadura alba]MBC6469100.1 flavoprotein [Actinomadura alba]